MNQHAPKVMTDAEATKLDWWLLDLLEDKLFNPKSYENKSITGGDQLDVNRPIAETEIKS